MIEPEGSSQSSMTPEAQRVHDMALEWINPSQQDPDREKFDSWLSERLLTERGADAARRLLAVEKAGIDAPEHPFSLLVHKVFMACRAAEPSFIGNDKGAQYRKSLATLRTRRAKIQKLSRELAADIGRFPALQWAFPAGFTVRKFKGPKTQNPQENLAELLRILAANLETYRLPEVDGGPFLHRFTYGCLQFEQPLTGKTSPTAVTGLLFHLTLLFRKWTATGSCFTKAGERMPHDGKPCYPAAVALVNTALKENLLEAQAQKQLASLMKTHGHNGVMLMPWHYSQMKKPQNPEENG